MVALADRCRSVEHLLTMTPGYDRAVRRNPGTVVVLTGPAPAQVLAAVDRSMNVTLIRPEGEDDPLTAASSALQRAARVSSPYALVPADPLAAVAASWEAMWDVSTPQGSAEFEAAASQALTAWRSGQFELPDYYLVLAPPPADPATSDATLAPSFHLGPLVSARAHRVAVVAAAEPAQQAAGVLHELGSLRHGPWWPPLDELLDTARRFYPDSLGALASL